MAVRPDLPKVFATKPFMRFAEKFGIDREALLAIVAAQPDADLGGGVFKFRLARAGQGTSGGARAIVAVKSGEFVVMMFGFQKKDLANINRKELVAFRKAAAIYCGYSESQIALAVKGRALIELSDSSTA